MTWAGRACPYRAGRKGTLIGKLMKKKLIAGKKRRNAKLPYEGEGRDLRHHHEKRPRLLVEKKECGRNRPVMEVIAKSFPIFAQKKSHYAKELVEGSTSASASEKVDRLATEMNVALFKKGWASGEGGIVPTSKSAIREKKKTYRRAN